MRAHAAEGFDDLVVARVLDEDGGRRVRPTGRIDVGAAIDSVVVKDHDADRQVVTADRFDLHAGEAEGAVTFDREHRLAGLDGGGDGITHADTHHAPGADIEALTRLIHVDDAAGEIERIGALVDQDGVGALLDDCAQGAERAVEVHRRGVFHQPRRHLGDVFVFLCLDGIDPIGRRRRPFVAHGAEKRGYAGADVADDRRRDFDIRVHFLRLDVDLNERLRTGFAPGLAFAVREQPVQPGSDQHHDVGIGQDRGARGAGALRMRVGQDALGHAHRQEGNAALLDQVADYVVGLRISGAFTEYDEWALGALQDVKRALDGGWSGNLRRRRIDDLDQRFRAFVR